MVLNIWLSVDMPLLFHGYVCNTGDIDILFNVTDANKERLIKALDEMGFETDYLRSLDFSKEVIAFHFGEPPERIDFLNMITGTDFESAYLNKFDVEVNDLTIHFIGLEELKKNKKSAAREKDLIDLKNLP